MIADRRRRLHMVRGDASARCSNGSGQAETQSFPSVFLLQRGNAVDDGRTG